jgi:hypothetical protein
MRAAMVDLSKTTDHQNQAFAELQQAISNFYFLMKPTEQEREAAIPWCSDGIEDSGATDVDVALYAYYNRRGEI